MVCFSPSRPLQSFCATLLSCPATAVLLLLCCPCCAVPVLAPLPVLPLLRDHT